MSGVTFIDLTHCDNDDDDHYHVHSCYKTTKYDLAKDPNYCPPSTITNEPQHTIVTRAKWAIEAKAASPSPILKPGPKAAMWLYATTVVFNKSFAYYKTRLPKRPYI